MPDEAPREVTLMELTNVCGGGPLGSSLTPIQTRWAYNGFVSAKTWGRDRPAQRVEAQKWLSSGDALSRTIQNPTLPPRLNQLL